MSPVLYNLTPGRVEKLISFDYNLRLPWHVYYCLKIIMQNIIIIILLTITIITVVVLEIKKRM